ncbi:hypothetical protein EG347_14970 [Chryseobacterium sp. G0186]|uniref:hypothetical protein n=1 Tax=Chryseobacterium sp. G0186 TaxID=2487064 RepID=UPI000F4E4E1E|nr:hypothetical protein [Chryseobacterium sp. G0186]AZA78714.1 hypothetical protein EG347_14970 [Chryseobacterium sp. G0186]
MNNLKEIQNKVPYDQLYNADHCLDFFVTIEHAEIIIRKQENNFPSDSTYNKELIIDKLNKFKEIHQDINNYLKTQSTSEEEILHKRHALEIIKNRQARTENIINILGTNS